MLFIFFVKSEDELWFGLGGMPDNENYGPSYAYTTWYAYLKLGLLQSNTVSCYTDVEYSRAICSTISVLPYLELYSTYPHVVSMII